VTLFGVRPTDFQMFSLFASENLQEELNTTEHKLLYDYLHFLTLRLHLFWGVKFGSKNSHGVFFVNKFQISIILTWLKGTTNNFFVRP